MSAPPFEGMNLEAFKRIRRLPADQQYRVLERASIIREACGCSWSEADARALAEELEQRRLPGVGT